MGSEETNRLEMTSLGHPLATPAPFQVQGARWTMNPCLALTPTTTMSCCFRPSERPDLLENVDIECSILLATASCKLVGSDETSKTRADDSNLDSFGHESVKQLSLVNSAHLYKSCSGACNQTVGACTIGMSPQHAALRSIYSPTFVAIVSIY